MFIEPPGEGVSTCRSRGTGEFTERTCDHVIASHSFQMRNVEVVEDFESRPHKAVTI